MPYKIKVVFHIKGATETADRNRDVCKLKAKFFGRISFPNFSSISTASQYIILSKPGKKAESHAHCVKLNICDRFILIST